MQILQRALGGVVLMQPRTFGDERGFFLESYNRRVFRELTGIDAEFVQDNHSRSARNVLRGLHYQIRQPQGKLVRVIVGAVFDVAVDLRRASPSFGQWFGAELNAENRNVMWVPPGFAHGFLVLSDTAEFLYKTTDYWAPAHERTLMWNDPAVGVAWPLSGEPVLSEKDKVGAALAAAEVYP